MILILMQIILLVKSSDSADNILTTVEYTYDAAGNTLQVQTQTDDTAMDTHQQKCINGFTQEIFLIQ